MLAAVGRGRATRGEASNDNAATWGLGLGVVGLVLTIVNAAVGAAMMAG